MKERFYEIVQKIVDVIYKKIGYRRCEKIDRYFDKIYLSENAKETVWQIIHDDLVEQRSVVNPSWQQRNEN